MAMAIAALGSAAVVSASALHCRPSRCLLRTASPAAALCSTSVGEPVLTSSFTARRPVASSSACSFVGLALRPSFFRLPTPRRTRGVLVRAKVAIGCTKRSRSRKAIARVSGFRKRMSTPTGRNVLRRRRAKGRKKLVPATNPNSGKYA